jgi:Protein of unknown function (DUF3302).
MNIWGWWLLILAVSTVINLIPGYVAYRRKHRNTLAIFVTSLVLGWTVIGWAVALIWAVLREPERA